MILTKPLAALIALFDPMTDTVKPPIVVILAVIAYLFIVFIITWALRKRRREPHHKVLFQRASPFRPEVIKAIDDIDTIVIGSGPGASTCANLLAQSGQKVVVLEKHSVTGGGTHSFRENNDCEFDTGLHYTSLAMSQPTARPGAIMSFMTQGKQHFQPIPEPCDEIVFPDTNTTFNYRNGKARALDAILNAIDPEDLELRRRARVYMDLYHECHQGFVALGLSRILPWWLQFLLNVPARKERLLKIGSMTVRDVQHAVLSLGYTQEQLFREGWGCPKATLTGRDPNPNIQRLKAILAHPIGDYGVQPREASMAAHGVTAEHYIDGGSYTVGPTQNISIRLGAVTEAYGGRVFVDATVRGIIMEKGQAVGVRVSNTSAMETVGPRAAHVTEIRAKNIVCGTTAYNLYNKILPHDLPIVHQFNDPTQRTIHESNGHNFVFCKIRGDPDELGLPDHNIWYFNSDDLDTAFDHFFADPVKVRPPIVYLGFPCTKDPTWKKRFRGVSNCIVISDGLYSWFEKWADKPARDRGADYDAFKEQLAKNLLDILYEKVPQVKGKVEYYKIATPLTEETFLGSFRGGAYDTLCTPAMFAPINQKWITTPHTQIPGLYQAGSSAFFPGLTGSMYGGCLCACAVLGTWKTLLLGHALITHLAKELQKENPKLNRFEAYRLAINKFVNE